MCLLSDSSNSHKTWDQAPPSQSESGETHISTTSATTNRGRKQINHSSSESQKHPHYDEIQALRLELARQEVREQTARAQEAEYRMEAARETARGAKAKADLAELELNQKLKLSQSDTVEPVYNATHL